MTEGAARHKVERLSGLYFEIRVKMLALILTLTRTLIGSLITVPFGINLL